MIRAMRNKTTDTVMAALHENAANASACPGRQQQRRQRRHGHGAYADKGWRRVQA